MPQQPWGEIALGLRLVPAGKVQTKKNASTNSLQALCQAGLTRYAKLRSRVCNGLSRKFFTKFVTSIINLNEIGNYFSVGVCAVPRRNQLSKKQARQLATCFEKRKWSVKCCSRGLVPDIDRRCAAKVVQRWIMASVISG